MLGQAKRARRGAAGLAGNHVVIAMSDLGRFVLVAHLQKGTVSVRIDDHVHEGEPIGQCGNSGNSTEPHFHVQGSDSTDWVNARGVPIAFRNTDGLTWLPKGSEIVQA